MYRKITMKMLAILRENHVFDQLFMRKYNRRNKDKMTRISLKTLGSIAFLLLAATTILAACGSDSATASPVAVVATPAGGSSNGGAGNGGGFGKAISGTIDTFSASANTLTI